MCWLRAPESDRGRVKVPREEEVQDGLDLVVEEHEEEAVGVGGRAADEEEEDNGDNLDLHFRAVGDCLAAAFLGARRRRED